MSKSTPISNLPNLKKQSGPAFEQRENEIVKEILNEIDNDKNASPPPPPQQAGPTPEQVQLMQQQQQAMVEQQMREQQMMEQQMMEQQMAAQLQQQQMNTKEVNKIVPEANTEPKSFVEQLLQTAKPSLLVAVIVAVVSLPFLGNMLEKVISSREALLKFKMPLTLLIKGLLGGAMFYGGSNALEL